MDGTSLPCTSMEWSLVEQRHGIDFAAQSQREDRSEYYGGTWEPRHVCVLLVGAPIFILYQ
jgi:hypothetical protein